MGGLRYGSYPPRQDRSLEGCSRLKGAPCGLLSDMALFLITHDHGGDSWTHFPLIFEDRPLYRGWYTPTL